MAAQSDAYTWEDLFQEVEHDLGNNAASLHYDGWCQNSYTGQFEELIVHGGASTSSSSCFPSESLPGRFDSIDMNEPHNLYLYTRVVLFFASSESTLEIRDCDRKTENTLRLFAVKFNLEHWYNSEAQVSMIRRPQQTPPSISKDQSDFVESLKSGSGSWNELDNTPRVRGAPGVSIGKAGGSCLPLSKEPLPYQHSVLLQDQPTQIVQQSMLDYQASNPTQHGIPKTVGENMRALRLAGGACWRCKILRKKCDSGQPCKACPSSVIRSIWQSIGCKRGSLCTEGIKLCPGAWRLEQVSQNRDLIAHVLEDATSRMNKDIASSRFVFVNDEGTTKLILPSEVVKPRPCANHNHDLNDCIDTIVWELTDNAVALELLHITSLSDFETLLLAAAQYEVECGKSSLVITALVCLLPCLQYCRLAANSLLGAESHNSCTDNYCNIACAHNLELHLKAYGDELSQVMFRKENLQNDRRWWLSVFYSLYIQSHVRHSLIMIERSTKHVSMDELSSHLGHALSSKEYLHIAVRLFAAASAGYDPIFQPPNKALATATQLLKYSELARDALTAEPSGRVTLSSSFDLLEDLFEIDREHRISRAGTRSLTFGTITPQQDLPDPSWGLDIQVEYTQIPPLLPSPQDFEQCDLITRPLPPPRDYDQSGQPFDILDDISTSSSTKDWLPRLKRRANSPPQDLGFPGSRSSTESLNEKFIQHSLSRKASSSSMNSAFESNTEYSYGSWPLTLEEIKSLETEFQRNSHPTSSRKKELADQLGLAVTRINNWYQNRRARAKQEAHSAAFEEPLQLRSSPLAGCETVVNPKDLQVGNPCESQVTDSSNASDDVPCAITTTQAALFPQEYSVCSCCPKKPKKFTNLVDLIAHEAEKRIQCSYCGNRFNNLNEKERHENSLHIRRYMWSCSQIKDVLSVFFAVRGESSESSVDECGYCGQRFPGAAVATDEDFEARLKHVVEAHNYRGCNSSKKFYRADHFRQHLKFSHSALIGEWTKGLEAYCMASVEADTPL